VAAAGRRDRPRGRDVPGELRVFPLLWGRADGQQVFRERDVRLDRDPLLPAAQEGLSRHHAGVAGTRREGCQRSAPDGIGAPARASPRRILQPGGRVVVPPPFHRPAEWAQRLRVGTGVAETDGSFFPQPSWRPPTTDELALLVRAADGPTTAEELEASVCLFQLPGHVRSEWWKLLEQSAGVPGEGP